MRKLHVYLIRMFLLFSSLQVTQVTAAYSPEEFKIKYEQFVKMDFQVITGTNILSFIVLKNTYKMIKSDEELPSNALEMASAILDNLNNHYGQKIMFHVTEILGQVVTRVEMMNQVVGAPRPYKKQNRGFR